MKKDFKDYIERDDKWFSESHLMSWFNTQYWGKSYEDAKYRLEAVHDESGEIEVAEGELGRELDDDERTALVKRFNEAVLNSIVCHRNTVVAFVDSLGETCVRGHDN